MTEDPAFEAAQARNDHERGIVPETLDDLRWDLERCEKALEEDLSDRDRQFVTRAVTRLRNLLGIRA